MEDITAKYKYQVEKITGKAGNGFECGVFNKNVVLPDGSDGLAVGCILAKGEGDLGVIVADIFNFEVTILETLGGEGILEPLKGIYSKVGAYIGERVLEVSFIVGFFYKGICYLIKDGEDVVVEVFDPPQSSQLDIKAGSGKLTDGQVYMIATKNCVELFDFGVLSEGEAELPEVIDGMATEISARENSVDIGAVFVKVTADLSSAEPEVLQTLEEFDAVVEEESPGHDEVEEVAYEQHDGAELVEPEETALAEPYAQETGVETETVTDKGGGSKHKVKGIFSGVKGIIGKSGREMRGVFKGDHKAIGSFRKKLVIIVIIIVLVLGISVGLAVKKRNDNARLAEFQTHFEAASSKYNEGASLLELNKFRAREILVGAQDEVKKALAIVEKDPDAQKLASDIESKLKDADVANATTFETVADVSAPIKSLSFSGKNLIAVGSQKAFQVTTGGGVTDSMSDLQNTLSGIVFDSKLFWIDSTGVLREALDGSGKVSILGKTSAYDIGVFFGNVYLLNSGQVSKIVPIEGGYAAPADYLKSSQSFKTSSRMAIDTNIWVTDGDKILKFNRGSGESFEIAGVSGKIGELGPIYTDGTLANLYVIDKSNSALLVVDKDGNYKKSLQAKELADATDLVVNDAEDTVYVSVGSKIVSASLK
jgi:hypothetical protein